MWVNSKNNKHRSYIPEQIPLKFRRKSFQGSVQFSSVVSDSLWSHELQHARPPCPSPTHVQTHVHWVGDAIQPSHPLSSPSPPAPNPSRHQGLSQWVNSSHEVAKVLEFQLQHQSFQWTPRTDLLWDGLVGSPCSPRDSQESSPAPQLKALVLRRSAFFTLSRLAFQSRGGCRSLTVYHCDARALTG